MVGIGDGGPNESKCLACGQIVDTMMDQALERGETAGAFPDSGERTGGRGDRKRSSPAVDLEKLLDFSQQLYAHALTLQEVIRNEGDVTYEVLRPGYDRLAAEQFKVFYHTFNRPSGCRKRSAASGE